MTPMREFLLRLYHWRVAYAVTLKFIPPLMLPVIVFAFRSFDARGPMGETEALADVDRRAM